MFSLFILFAVYHITQKPKVSVLNWDFYIGKHTIDSFQQEEGVSVDYKIYSSNEEARFFIEQSPGTYDIVVPSDYMIQNLIDSDLLSAIDLTSIPNVSEIEKDAISEFDKRGWLKFCVPYLYGNTGFAINTANIKGIDASEFSWNYLIRDVEGEQKLKRRVVVLDDARQVLGSVLMENGWDPNNPTDEQLNKAVGILSRIRPLILEFSADTGKSRMLNSEVDVAFAWSGDSLQVKSKNPNWSYAVPNGGGIKFQDGICIPKDSPNKENAYKFMNHLLEKSVHLDIIMTTKYLTTNRAAKMSLKPAEKVTFKVSEPKNMKFLESLSGKELTRFESAWERVKG